MSSNNNITSNSHSHVEQHHHHHHHHQEHADRKQQQFLDDRDQDERELFVNKFNLWSSQDQVEFVERLLGKMAHCQHRRIDAALQPMLERDLIHSMLPVDDQLGLLGSVGGLDFSFGSNNHHHNHNNPFESSSDTSTTNTTTTTIGPINGHTNHHHHPVGAIGTIGSHQHHLHNNGNNNSNPNHINSNHNNLLNHHNHFNNHHPNSLNHHHSFGTTLAGSISPNSTDPLMDLSAKLINSATLLPIKSQCKRQKMIYHCKFGEFGVMEGQFTEPSGVAVNAQNDIIVADTNNHRIQIFDNEGRFKFQFGECGKRDGQLLYPNRVAVVKSSGDIIVTERSPTHQIQVYTQYGQFVRKFGANILQHPRGVTVDNKGRIIVVECKVMRVIIFDQLGNVLHKFGCSKHLEFPNGVVVNDQQEIFISDNRAHCVKVFSYQGDFLRQIGGEGLTNYPIGVCINDAGEILVADNHNNFNITIFNQDGTLISALESKVKHAQCFDVALMDDNSVVLASKDYRIYIYRYLQMQALTSLTPFE